MILDIITWVTISILLAWFVVLTTDLAAAILKKYFK